MRTILVSFYFLAIFVHLSATNAVNGKDHDAALSQKVKIPGLKKFFLLDYSYSRLLKALQEQEKYASTKQMAEQNQLQQKEERENEIFLKKLASKVQSSFLKDFHTLRY